MCRTGHRKYCMHMHLMPRARFCSSINQPRMHWLASILPFVVASIIPPRMPSLCRDGTAVTETVTEFQCFITAVPPLVSLSVPWPFRPCCCGCGGAVQSEMHGRALIQKAVCLDSLARCVAATPLPSPSGSYPSPALRLPSLLSISNDRRLYSCVVLCVQCMCG